jgi:hypothetical protein
MKIVDLLKIYMGEMVSAGAAAGEKKFCKL